MNNLFGQLTLVVKNLLIINVILFLLSYIFKGMDWFESGLVLHYVQSSNFRPHQIVTHMFMHADFWHLFGNMIGLWMFGSMLESVWGPKRFLIFYFICGIGAVLCDQLYMYIKLSPQIEYLTAFYNQSNDKEQISQIEEVLSSVKNQYTLRGASGAVFGLIMGAAMIFPNREIMIYFAIPVKLKWLAIIYGVMQFISIVQNNPTDNVAHLVHLCGMFFGFVTIMIWKRSKNNFY